MENMTGKVWILGDDIDTDIIIPTEYLAMKTINDMKKKIDIYFQKVLAHSGDYYNEVADGLAKKAVGIKK